MFQPGKQMTRIFFVQSFTVVSNSYLFSGLFRALLNLLKCNPSSFDDLFGCSLPLDRELEVTVLQNFSG